MELARLTTVTAYVEWSLSLGCLLILLVSGQARIYRFLTAALALRTFSAVLCVLILHNMQALHLRPAVAYFCYFYVYWFSFGLGAMLSFGIIVDVYRQAMEPLRGLQNLGMMMFRWAVAISIVLALTIALGDRSTPQAIIVRAIMEVHQLQAVLTLCMLVFVCYAIHPMGLTYRSRIFGVALGLGIVATSDLVCTSTIFKQSSVVSIVNVVESSAFIAAALLWCVYLVIPEPRRRLILLPTTSPFFKWNQVSEILGDAPGYVAIGQVGLDMFAPAELEVMRRASSKMPAA